MLNGLLNSIVLAGIFVIIAILAAVIPCAALEAVGDLVTLLVLAATLLYPAIVSLLMIVSGAYASGWSGFFGGLGWALLLTMIAGAGWVLLIYSVLGVNFCGTF